MEPAKLSPPPSPDLHLGIPGFRFADLHDAARLADLTRAFVDSLRSADTALFARYDAHRGGAARQRGPAESELLLEVGAHVSRFLTRLFGAEKELGKLREAAGRDAPIFRVKREFVQRRVFKKGAKERPTAADFPALDSQVRPLLDAAGKRDPRASSARDDPELLVASVIDTLLGAERAQPASQEFFAWRDLCGAFHRGLADAGLPNAAYAGEDVAAARDLLDLFDRWLYAFSMQPDRPAWVLLRLPHALDFQQLVPLSRPDSRNPAILAGHDEHQRRRDGFQLTDPRMGPREVRSEIDYCIYCHEREKDSCAKGFPEKDSPRYKKNPLGIPLTGCPLEERISEMHTAAREGDALSALALVCIDNPMAPGTGHRICNDCMKACVYQKQDPVNIPQIETRVLSDVLRMRWGFEIWSLLTRWNPLRFQRQHPRPYAGINALVVGMGPAGYTLAHHLLNEGFGVVGIDGLKIEPIPEHLLARPLERLEHAFGSVLDERVTSGFGGVSEYGITVRWDKTFLDVLHLNLARRTHFRLYGGTRFGGTVTAEDAFDRYGFHHLALAAGAGRPTIIGLKNNLIRGVRKASDFLMALQLTGAFKKGSLANLQVALPAVVIGGGLTAIDAATELAAYYPIQVEKLLERHERLCESGGEEMVFSVLDTEERHLYAEALEHGRAVRAERERVAGTGEAPDFSRLVKAWGGVTIAYRKSLNDSPAYRLNHEEVIKALEEGIYFAEGLSPVEAVPDGHGAVQAVKFSSRGGGEVTLRARTLCVAAGTSPNTTVEKEAPGHFEIDPEHASFRCHRLVDGKLVPAEVIGDLSGTPGFFTSYSRNGRHVSFFGDNHPVYAGSVVKAMASAKEGYPRIAELFARELAAADGSAQPVWTDLTARLDDELIARVHEVKRLTPTIIEAVVRAPARAAGGGDGPDRGPLDHSQGRGRGAVRRRSRQRGAVQHLARPARQRLPRGVLRGLPPRAGRLQARRDRGVHRRGGLVGGQGEQAPDPAAAAGPRGLGKHGGGDGGLRDREPGRAAHPLQQRPEDHRHRLGPDDGRRGAGAAQRAEAAVARGSRRHRVDQLADAVHDEGDLRAVPVQAPRPADGQGELRVLLLRSGPADGRDGLGEPAHAAARELAAREAVGAVAGVLDGADGATAGVTKMDWLKAAA